MTGSRYSFDAQVWEHVGPTAWFFLSVPEPITDEIDELFGHLAAGFGSLRVEVRIGSTTWRTSIFPDTKRGAFVLPLKKAVRVAENLSDGAIAEVHLQVLPED